MALITTWVLSKKFLVLGIGAYYGDNPIETFLYLTCYLPKMYHQNTENHDSCGNDVGVSATDALINRLRACQKKDELDLSLCSIVQVPLMAIKKYCGQPNAIDLSFNSIRYLGSRFALEVSNVTKLDLSRNELEKLPNNFGMMKQLVYLDVHQNKLTTLPLSFGKLSRLQYLCLSDNPFHKPLQQFLENAGNEASGVTLAKLVVLLLQRMDAMQMKRSQKARRDRALTKRSSKVRMELLRNVIPEMDDEQSYASSKSEPETKVEESSRKEFFMRQGQSSGGTSFMKQDAVHATSTPSKTKSMTKSKSATAVGKKKPLRGLFNLLERVAAFMAIWMVMFPILVAYNVETPYLEHMVEEYPIFGEIWTYYQDINRWAQYLPYYFPIAHNSQWVLRAPPPPESSAGFIEMITDFIYYIGNLFESMFNYVVSPSPIQN